MKVCITANTKKWLTLEQLPIAKQIIEGMKEDEWSAKEYLDMAASCWLHNAENGDEYDHVAKVLSATAEIAGNSRVWDWFGGSGHIDIWLDGTVETNKGFLKIGCYFSDICNIGPEECNRAFPSHCYTKYYTEKRR